MLLKLRHWIPAGVYPGLRSGAGMTETEKTMNIQKGLFILTIVLFAITARGWAQTSEVLNYKQMDQNGDGAVSKVEFQDQAFQQAFKQVDANGDGNIDYSEWQKYDSSPGSKKHFDDLDQDRNGDLSLMEFKNGKFSFLNPEKVLNGETKPPADQTKNPDEIFNQLDNDQNNLLTDEEIPSDNGVKIVSFKF